MSTPLLFAERNEHVDDPTRALTTLPDVTLRELDEAAALQHRRDHKYVLTPAQGAALTRELAGVGGRRVLEIDGRRTFRYESTYFDTDHLELYRAAVQGRRQRAKVRIRRYVDTGSTFLEVKLRDKRGMQQKHRMAIERPALRLDVDMRRFVDSLVGPILGVGFAKTLRPTSITRYRRTTILHDASATRATFDTDLVCFDIRPREPGKSSPAMSLDAIILESKSGSGNADLDRMLWGRGLRPVKISKYCTGLAALDPELPSNRWNRTLRDHFGAS